MSYPFYKVLHLAGVVALFLAWGALLLLPSPAQTAATSALSRRRVMLTHGLALLFIFVAGFGLLARLGIHWPWPGWVWGKALLWLTLGAGVVVAKRLPRSVSWLWWLIPLLGALASFLAIYKPF